MASSPTCTGRAGTGAGIRTTGRRRSTLGNAAAQYQPGFNAYGDASGANGVQGLQRATDVYHNSGQYGAYGVANDAAQQAIQRTAAAGGMGASGNVINAATNKALDLGNQYWGQYQQGLQPYLQYPAQIAAAQGTLSAGLGNALNSSYQGQGGAANTTQTTIGNNNAGAEMNNYKVGANDLSAITGLGSLATGAFGAGWAKPLGSALFSSFSGGGSPSGYGT